MKKTIAMVCMLVIPLASCKTEEKHKIQHQPVWETSSPRKKPTPVVSCKKWSKDHRNKCLKFG